MKFSNILNGFVLLLAIALSGCASSTFKVMPEYRNQMPGSRASLAVVLNTDGVEVDNESSIREDWGEGDPRLVFADLVDNHFPMEMKKYAVFATVEMVTPLLSDSADWINLPLKDRVLRLKLPREESRFRFAGGGSYSHVLMIHKIRTFEFYGKTTGTGGENTARRYLKFDFEYLLWDNVDGKIIAYGYAEAEDPVFFRMSRDTWLNALGDMGQKTLRGTLYGRRKNVY